MPDDIDKLFAAMAAMARTSARLSGGGGFVCGMGFIVSSSDDFCEIEAQLRQMQDEMRAPPGCIRIIEGECAAWPPAAKEKLPISGKRF